MYQHPWGPCKNTMPIHDPERSRSWVGPGTCSFALPHPELWFFIGSLTVVVLVTNTLLFIPLIFLDHFARPPVSQFPFGIQGHWMSKGCISPFSSSKILCKKEPEEPLPHSQRETTPLSRASTSFQVPRMHVRSILWRGGHI